MMTEAELRGDLAASRDAQEVADLVDRIAGLTSQAIRAPARFTPYAIAAKVLLGITRAGSKVAKDIYSTREQRIILEISRRYAEELILEGQSPQR